MSMFFPDLRCRFSTNLCVGSTALANILGKNDFLTCFCFCSWDRLFCLLWVRVGCVLDVTCRKGLRLMRFYGVPFPLFLPYHFVNDVFASPIFLKLAHCARVGAQRPRPAEAHTLWPQTSPKKRGVQTCKLLSFQELQSHNILSKTLATALHTAAQTQTYPHGGPNS